MYKYNDSKNMDLDIASYFSKMIIWHGKKSPVEDDEIEIVGTSPISYRKFHQLAYK